MCLEVHLMLLIVGLVGLIGGNLSLSSRLQIKGRAARVIGLILALPLPLYLILSTIPGLTWSPTGGD